MLEWSVDDREELVKKRTLEVFVKEFSVMLKTISGNQLHVAYLVLQSFLERENNKFLRDRIVCNNYSNLIVSAMKDFVRKTLRKKKSTQEKEALAALVSACTTYLPAHVSQNKIRDMLGLERKSFYTHMKRETCNTNFKHVVRKDRVVPDLVLQQRDCVEKFCHSDEASSIDSNSRQIVDVTVDGEIEHHFGRVWNVPTVREQHNLLVQSDTVEEYKTLYPGFKTPGKTFFFKN